MSAVLTVQEAQQRLGLGQQEVKVWLGLWVGLCGEDDAQLPLEGDRLTLAFEQIAAAQPLTRRHIGAEDALRWVMAGTALEAPPAAAPLPAPDPHQGLRVASHALEGSRGELEAARRELGRLRLELARSRAEVRALHKRLVPWWKRLPRWN